MPAGTLVPAHGSPPRTVTLPNSGTANLQSLAGLEKLTMIGTGAVNMGLMDTSAVKGLVNRTVTLPFDHFQSTLSGIAPTLKIVGSA